MRRAQPLSLILSTLLLSMSALYADPTQADPTRDAREQPRPQRQCAEQLAQTKSAAPTKKRKKNKWELQAEQLEQVRALRREKKRAKRFKALEASYQQAKGEERARLLAELTALDLRRATPLLREALSQRLEMDWRVAALKAMQRPQSAQSAELRELILKSMTSPYVLERRALVELFMAWGCEVGARGLRDLAADKSVSVRRDALNGLGQLGEGLDVLESYALDGPDEGSAESAAQAWLVSAQHNAQHSAPTSPSPELNAQAIAFKLLHSRYQQVRALGVAHLKLKDHQLCPTLVAHTLTELTHEGAELSALDELNASFWGRCGERYLIETRQAKALTRAQLLSAIARWRVKGREVTKLARSQLTHLDPKVRSGALRLLDQGAEGEERATLIASLTHDPNPQTRCVALEALLRAPLPHPLSPTLTKALLKQLKGALERHLPTPTDDLTEREWLSCVLKAIGDLSALNITDLDPLALKAYSAWRRSIAYGRERLWLVEAMSRATSAARLEILMEAMLDPNEQVKALAERALRARR